MTMDFKKALFLLGHEVNPARMSDAIGLCKEFKSRLFVLFVIEPHRISRLASLTRQKTENLYKKIEEDGWQMLYLVEDEAVDNGVWTSLHLEDGNTLQVIRKYVASYDINVILTERNNETKKLFVASPIPVIGL